MTLADGTPLSPALGIGAFAEKTLVAAGQATKVDAARQARGRRAARLRRDGRIRRRRATPATSARDDSIAVFGCGGVGNAAIAAARLAGAHTIIGVDLDARKLEWAQGLRRDAHGRRVEDRRGRGDPRAHQRQRRRRVRRGGRPARGA